MSHLEQGNTEDAVFDLERAYAVDEESFDINLGLVRAYFLQEKFGSAFQKVEACRVLAETDEQTAIAHYWKALVQEKRGEQASAVEEWQALLAMDPEAMTEEMRTEADRHLRTIITPTNTLRPTTRTSTPAAIRTLTPTPKGGTPTRTPTPTP
jgi:tetratricopeptide (TPR) repeat protein